MAEGYQLVPQSDPDDPEPAPRLAQKILACRGCESIFKATHEHDGSPVLVLNDADRVEVVPTCAKCSGGIPGPSWWSECVHCQVCSPGDRLLQGEELKDLANYRPVYHTCCVCKAQLWHDRKHPRVSLSRLVKRAALTPSGRHLVIYSRCLCVHQVRAPSDEEQGVSRASPLAGTTAPLPSTVYLSDGYCVEHKRAEESDQRAANVAFFIFMVLLVAYILSR
jgi:hypothetical protein